MNLNFNEIGIYTKTNEFTITDHKHFKLNFEYGIKKETNQKGFYLTSFYIKNVCVFNQEISTNKIFIFRGESFLNFFNSVINFLKQVENIHQKRINTNNDLNELEKSNKIRNLTTLFVVITNKIKILYSLFHNNKNKLKDYSNIYDFFILRSSFHIYKLNNELFYFYLKTNEYNQHEVYFLSTILKEYGFNQLPFKSHSDAIDYYFDDYKLFNFLSKIDSIFFDKKTSLLLKKNIMDYIEELEIIESQKLYSIKDIYKKRHED